MEVVVIFLQIILPLALILWFAIHPLQSIVGSLIQALATLVMLVALWLVGQWLIPPFWTPWLYFCLFALVVLVRLSPVVPKPNRTFPGHWTGWIGVGFFSLSLIVFTFTVYEAIAGRKARAIETIDLAFPLGEGRYWIANGGSREMINAHYLTLDPKTERQAAYHGQSYAIDLIQISNTGFRATGWRPADPAQYLIYGKPVYAVCDGSVISAASDRPDMPVPMTDQKHIEGNHVLLDCGGFAVLVGHLRQGSVTVKAGDQVAKGDQLGEVGNSGQTAEPHLHIHAQRPGPPDKPFGGEPIQITLAGQFLVRGQRFER